MLRAGTHFFRLDKVADVRQLHEVAELSASPRTMPTRCPDHMMLKMAAGQRRIEGDELDFRDEIYAHLFKAGDERSDRLHGLRHFRVRQGPQERAFRDSGASRSPTGSASARCDSPRPWPPTTAITSSTFTTPAGATTGTTRPRRFGRTSSASADTELGHEQQFDVIVIGSGFGGAITARRLAEKGMNVLILERGRRWDPATYSAEAGRRLDLQPRRAGTSQRLARHAFLQTHDRGAGGRSRRRLVDIQQRRPRRRTPSSFTRGWPAEITYAELKPYYDTVAREMDLQVVPDRQLTPRFKIAREAAHNLGYDGRFSKAGLTVSFSEDWHPDLDDASNPKHSKPFVNAHGQQQGTCVHLGNCDIGCDVRAKNSLDVNYIPRAEQHGAEVRPLARGVDSSSRADGSYRVVFDRIEDGRLIRGEETAQRVIVAAGSLGTTEFSSGAATIPDACRPSARLLGMHWSGNANFISMGSYRSDTGRVKQSTGVTISSVLDFTDGSFKNQRFAIEDDGFPNVILNALKACLDNQLVTSTGKALLEAPRAPPPRGPSPQRPHGVAGRRHGRGRWPVPPEAPRVDRPALRTGSGLGRRGLAWRARRHRRDAEKPDAGHRRSLVRPAHLEPLQEPADPAPAWRLQDGRVSRYRCRRPPRSGVGLSQSDRGRRGDPPHVNRPQSIPHDRGSRRTHRRAHLVDPRTGAHTWRRSPRRRPCPAGGTGDCASCSAIH